MFLAPHNLYVDVFLVFRKNVTEFLGLKSFGNKEEDLSLQTVEQMYVACSFYQVIHTVYIFHRIFQVGVERSRKWC